MIYKVEVFIEVAKGFECGRLATENLVESILKEALPDAFLIRDVTVEVQS